jgi:hypothetical protein
VTNQIKYTCGCCGKTHYEWPALTFSSPDAYSFLSGTAKENIAEISSDFCIITHPKQTDRFIRCTLTQKVTDHCEDLEYGFWVSLSEKSYQDYSDNYKNENHETSYFGWLCNNIAQYDFAESIPTTVYTKKGNSRPEIVPHENFDHPFVRDYYNGISKEEAEIRIKQMLDSIEGRKEQKEHIKPWWKFWI